MSLLFLEGSLRLLGYSPTEFKQNIAWSPKIGYATDSLGINLKKGYYTVTINNCLKYAATHTIDGRRITSIVPNLPRKKNKIYIFVNSIRY